MVLILINVRQLVDGQLVQVVRCIIYLSSKGLLVISKLAEKKTLKT